MKGQVSQKYDWSPGRVPTSDECPDAMTPTEHNTPVPIQKPRHVPSSPQEGQTPANTQAGPQPSKTSTSEEIRPWSCPDADEGSLQNAGSSDTCYEDDEETPEESEALNLSVTQSTLCMGTPTSESGKTNFETVGITIPTKITSGNTDSLSMKDHAKKRVMPKKYRKSERGLSYLFPSLVDQQLTLLDKVKITIARHINNYFLHWTQEELDKVEPIIRPKMIITEEIHKKYCHRNAMKYDSNLQFAMSSTEPWGQEFRDKLTRPPCRGGFSSLCEVKQEAGALWKKYGKYKMHNVIKVQMDINNETYGRHHNNQQHLHLEVPPQQNGHLHPGFANRGGPLPQPNNGFVNNVNLRNALHVHQSGHYVPFQGSLQNPLKRKLAPTVMNVTQTAENSVKPLQGSEVMNLAVSDNIKVLKLNSDDGNHNNSAQNPDQTNNNYSVLRSLLPQNGLIPINNSATKNNASLDFTSSTTNDSKPENKSSSESLLAPLSERLTISEQLHIWIDWSKNSSLQNLQRIMQNVPDSPQIQHALDAINQFITPTVSRGLVNAGKILSMQEPWAVSFQEKIKFGEFTTVEQALGAANALWHIHMQGHQAQNDNFVSKSNASTHTLINGHTLEKQTPAFTSVNKAPVETQINNTQFLTSKECSTNTMASTFDKALKNMHLPCKVVDEKGSSNSKALPLLTYREDPHTGLVSRSSEQSSDSGSYSIDQLSELNDYPNEALDLSQSSNRVLLQKLWGCRKVLHEKCGENLSVSWHERTKEFLPILRERLGPEYCIPNTTIECVLDLALCVLQNELKD